MDPTTAQCLQMAWTEEVHSHRSQVERRRERLRKDGTAVDDSNRTEALPVVLVLAVVSSLYVWLEGRHKVSKGGFFRRVPLLCRLFGGPSRPRDARMAARRAAEERQMRAQVKEGSISVSVDLCASGFVLGED